MKHSLLPGIGNIFILIVCLIISVQINAQNTSYSANTIPIGGTNSTGIGSGALAANTGAANIAIGPLVLNDNTTGSSNIAVGFSSLRLNITGSQNVAIGRGALYSNISGGNNTAIGYAALTNSLSNFNTAIGYSALYSNTTGTENTASGTYALYSNTTGFWNTASGQDALYSNTTGFSNTASGLGALYSNTTGTENTASGRAALYSNTTGDDNTGTGSLALSSNTTGNANTAHGRFSLRSNVTGNNNVAVGDSAGFKSLGSNNIYLGKRAGFYETGSDKLYIGNDSNKTVIYSDMATGQVLLGNQQPTGYTFKGTRTLNVLGGIITDSMRVSLANGWADHVFRDDYRLKPLTEVEQYIKTNKHLPNIPSSKEVAENGIELGDINTKLLEKIEELTLYIIQQQKNYEALEKEMAEMKTKIN